MNKTIFGLAYLNHNWEKDKKDLLDSYIPLLCDTILDNNIIELERRELQSLFLNRFGINIPLNVISSLLRRMKKNGLIKIKDKVYKVADKDAITSYIKNRELDPLVREFDRLISDMQKYSSDEYEVELERLKVENGILDFLSENGISLLFGVNPEYKVIEDNFTKSKRIRYIISNFIYHIYKNNSDRFSTILNISKGYSIASVLSYKNFDVYTGKLNNVEIFIDAPIIYNILGVNGESNYLATDELLRTLNRNNAKLRVFKVNEGEVINTMEDAIKRLTTKNYDIEKSSRILRTAVREGGSAADLQIRLNKFESVLNKYEIEVVNFPEHPESEYKFQINEQKLTRAIESNYTKTRNSNYLPWYSMRQIERDVQCISATFRLRKDQRAISLKACKAIFLTNNSMLAFTARIFESEESRFVSIIPICITDSFLSSILWVNYPDTNDSVNIKQLLSTCYSNIELDNQILIRYMEDIKNKHKDELLTDEQFYLLSSSNSAYKLLQDKTLNDIEEYSDKTPSEILEELSFKQKAELRFEKEKYNKVKNRVDLMARILSKSITILFAVFLVIGYVFIKPNGFTLGLDIYSILISLIVLFLTLFAVLRWANLVPDILGLEKNIHTRIYNSICNVLNIEN